MFPTTPERWLILQSPDSIDGPEVHKVFGTWGGGYLFGDSWRLNSGIVKTVFHDTHYEFQGHSGSVYQCRHDGYGLAGMSNNGPLQRFVELGMKQLSFEEVGQWLSR